MFPQPINLSKELRLLAAGCAVALVQVLAEHALAE